MEQLTCDSRLNFVHPIKIYLMKRPYNKWTCRSKYIVIVITITRVSHIDGADAYNKPDSEDELLSKFK
jgi:hypothetical protein